MVRKKDRQYCLINTTIKYNIVTIWDANLLPNINKVSKDFARYKVISLINLFSRYNYITLTKLSKDITRFIIPISLLRHITLI